MRFRKDWWEQARCKGQLDLFNYGARPSEDNDKVELALSICGTCPVRYECARDIEESNDDWPYQVAAGLRLWVDEDVAQLPAGRTFYKWKAPPRKVGRPAGFSADKRSPTPPTKLEDQPFEEHAERTDKLAHIEPLHPVTRLRRGV